MKEPFKLLLICCSLLCFILAATAHKTKTIGVESSVARFRVDSRRFAQTISRLDSALENVNGRKPETIDDAKKALRQSRIAYKRIEYFLEYFFFTSTRIYNRAPKNEIEEPNLEYQEPAGFQYIEALLFDSLPERHKSVFRDQIRLLSLSAANLNALLYQFQGTDKQLLESTRLELVRIIALGITGFDAPLLKSGIEESRTAMESIRNSLLPYVELQKGRSDSLSLYLDRSLQYLDKNPGFDSFDRLKFLSDVALPLQKHLGKMIREMDLELNTYGVLNYKSDHIFSKNAFNDQSFPGGRGLYPDKETALGRKLFLEKSLSGNNSKSCASCHHPDHYFMDGLAKSIGFETNSTVKRNAPSLFYASRQHSQFWDGRAKSLEEQIESVIKDPTEMNGNISVILNKLNRSKTYRKIFKEAFAKPHQEKISEFEIYRAIAAFVKTLNPYGAPFDQYISGNKSAKTQNQISGFNLFMGKAQCGTCHFAPLFNGLIPPFYALTEFEVLGTTLTDSLENPQPDPDQGRFSFRKTWFYKGAFKTPTVRNSAVTAPYMHNGSFKSLETVMEFYNQGGGAGLGLELPNQTLSSGKLNLSEQEKQDIIAFLHALTDAPGTKKIDGKL